MKVTPTQIRAAMEQCEGCIAKAAVILGLARPNLYKRLASLGIAPDSFRPRRGNAVAPREATPTVVDTSATAHDASDSRRSRVAHSRPVILTPDARGRIVATVTSAATATEATAAGSDTEQPKKQLRMTRSFYLRPDQAKAIDDACLDLPAVLREQMSPSKVMERYLDWGFRRFVAEMKGEQPTPPRRAKKGTE